MKHLLITLLLMVPMAIGAQVDDSFDQFDDNGSISRNGRNNGNFNPHNNDTTRAKEIPRGIYVWTVDRRFGDIQPAIVDTVPHLFMNSVFNTGTYGEYNTTGNNYTARQNRIFFDRPETDQFMFLQPYSWVYKQPDQFHFTNTLSPLTNVTYDDCGDKQNGEDYLGAKFAVNANKRIGFGFNVDYAYARGYFSNQNTSHFGTTLFGSYLGDQYKMHIMLSTYNQKVAENGGITNDLYITHPESFDDSYLESEIPTVMSRNWNRLNHQHVFLTHRYSLGFYRKEKMTEEELKARQFASDSKKEREAKSLDKGKEERQPRGRGDTPVQEAPAGRPADAAIAGDEPVADEPQPADSTRIKIDGQAALDSIRNAQLVADSIDATMKKVFVPVTSFIHTLELNKYERTYLFNPTSEGDIPTGYYANQYYLFNGRENAVDSINDITRLTQIKNTLTLALLEGFNKYAKAGLKAFISHEYRRFQMPNQTDSVAYMENFSEHNVSIGAQLQKAEGQTLHYNATLETWLAGEDAGQLKLDASADLNFAMPLIGDTVQLAARAYFHRLNPTFYQRRYHSQHFWWDNNGMAKETRTRIEGTFSYRKTNTKLRVGIEEIQNYTYLGMSYDFSETGRQNLTAHMAQEGGNINLLTAQLQQNFRLGPLNWENIVTYQSSSNQDVLPLPTLNVWTNLYLKFKIAHVLSVELGADAWYFTKYTAPDFCPQLNQFAVQQNKESRVELGGYPFIDVYANMHLKRARFFLMMSHVNNGMGNKMAFLVPHYPVNSSVLRFGVSWNFFN